MSTQPIDYDALAKKYGALSEEQPTTAPATQAATPGFWDRFKDQPEDRERDQALLRGARSVGSTILGIPSALYHAAADPATEEEKARLGETGMRNIGPVGRIIERGAIEPIRTAADWYTRAAKGQIPNAYEQALSVAPEALGAGGGAVLGGKIASAGERISPNVNFRPSVERISGGTGTSPLGRIGALPPPSASGISVDFRPSIERILPETAGAPGPVGRVLGEAEPDIDTEMRTGSPNPEPPPTPKPLETQIGTPEEEARIKEMMQGRSAKKLDLERGASTPEELNAVGAAANAGVPPQLDARLAQVLDQLSREPKASEAGPSAIKRAQARLGPPKKGTRIPGPEEDLTGLLNRSLKRVQSKRSQ